MLETKQLKFDYVGKSDYSKRKYLFSVLVEASEPNRLKGFAKVAITMAQERLNNLQPCGKFKPYRRYEA